MSIAKQFLIGTGLTLSLGGSALASEWEIDPSHSAAQFSVKHMMVATVRGQFEKMTGTINFDEKDPTKSTVNIVIDASTINTREPKRDAHLKSPDFFDVAKNPQITFKSTKVEKGEPGKLKVTGDLTMRGVTKPATLTVEGPSAAFKNPYGKTVRAVSGTGKVNRKDWGLNWNKPLEAAGGVLVSDEVNLQVDAELVEKAADAAAAKAPVGPGGKAPAGTVPAGGTKAPASSK